MVAGGGEPRAAPRIAEERLEPLRELDRRLEPAHVERGLVEIEQALREERVVVEERGHPGGAVEPGAAGAGRPPPSAPSTNSAARAAATT